MYKLAGLIMPAFAMIIRGISEERHLERTEQTTHYDVQRAPVQCLITKTDIRLSSQLQGKSPLTQLHKTQRTSATVPRWGSGWKSFVRAVSVKSAAQCDAKNCELMRYYDAVRKGTWRHH